MSTKRRRIIRSYDSLKPLNAWEKRNNLFNSNSRSFIAFEFNVSPIKFNLIGGFVLGNELNSYGKMTVDRDMLNGQFLWIDASNFMNIEYLPNIYNQPNLNRIIVEKTLLEKNDLLISLVKIREDDFVLKSFPVIVTDILNKFELLGQLVGNQRLNTDLFSRVLSLAKRITGYDRKRIMFRLFEEFDYDVNSIENFYLDTGLFDDKKEEIEKGIELIKNSFTVVESNDKNDELIYNGVPSMDIMRTLYNFYNYICLNMIFRTYSDANAESIIGLFCNQLVLTKTAPGFCLTYATFKTNSKQNPEFIPSNMKPSLEIYTHGIPMQHIAIERMDKTLFDLMKEGYFSLDLHDINVVCERYLDLILQITMSLYSAQKRYGFVHNDLHPKNIMIKYYDGPIIYCLDEKKIDNADKVFPPENFPRDENGFIKLRLLPKLGFYNIIDFGMAVIKTSEVKINSRTMELIARSHHVDNYNPYNLNNDILKMFVGIYDDKFHSKLLELFDSGNASLEIITLTYIFDQVYTCHLADENTMEWLFNVKEEKCGANDNCNLLFSLFGAYGYGDQPRCENPDGAIPENLLKYLDMFCDPKIDMDEISLCYSIV